MRALENLIGLCGFALAIAADVYNYGFGYFVLGLVGIFISSVLNVKNNNKRRGF